MQKKLIPFLTLIVLTAIAPGISQADSQKPSTVNGLSGTAISSTSIRLNWNKPWDNNGVVGYNIYRNGSYYSTARDTNFIDNKVKANSSYRYSITAFDEARNYATRSDEKTVSTIGVSSSSNSSAPPPPENNGSFGTPTNFRATSSSGSQVILQWSGSGKGFNVYRDSSYVGTANSNSYTDTGVSSNRSYTYYVTAFDGNGNRSGKSAFLSVNTGSTSNVVAPPAPETTNNSAFSTPSNLQATKATGSEVILSWNGGGKGFNVYRDNKYFATVHSNSYSDKGVSSNRTYSYYVTAFDGNGRYSAKSQLLSVSTDGSTSSSSSNSSGTISVARNLSGESRDGNHVRLTWDNPSSGNVKGYNIYRNNGFYKSVSANSYDDWGVSKNSTYTYKVVAYDYSSNRASASSTISVTVTDSSSSSGSNTSSSNTTYDDSVVNRDGPISEPRNLRSQTLNANQVKLTWDHPASGIATSYNLYQDNNYIKTVYGNTYTVPWIESGRDYRYYLTAIDPNKKYSAKSISIFANTSRTFADTTTNDRDASSVPSGYSRVFSEEFNSSSLDSNKWTSRYKWGPDWLINHEKQYYVDILNIPDFGYQPFVLDGNYLTIKADKTPDWLKSSVRNQPYLSGVLNTYNKFKMKYGYVEMRAKMPKGKGLWSAFWLLHHSNDLSRPEIDVTEVLGHKSDVAYQTYHYYSGNNLKSTPSNPVYGQDYSQDFHTYGMQWEPGKITWYVNGEETFTYSGGNVSSEDMYLIVNLAVGGWWPGDPDSSTEFPAEMKIDYIRAYQR